MNFTPEEVASTIDHTNLKPDAGKEDIEKLCREGIKYNFSTVVVAPYFVRMAVEILEGTDVGVCTTCSFPLGHSTTKTRIQEIRDVKEIGAADIDMVVNISSVKDGKWDYVRRELEETAEETGETIFKLIFENCFLTDEEIQRLSEICVEVEGLDYIKTSTGFGEIGARIQDVRIMQEAVGDKIKIKAAGGIRTADDYSAMRRAGADKIGTSSGVEIVNSFM